MDDAQARAAAAKERLLATLRADPELAAALKQSIENLRKPENIKAMADPAVRLFEALKAIQHGRF
jgi:hypothetical protein